MISTIGGFFDLNHFDQSSRANDVIVIRHRDGSLHSTPFSVRFGRARIWNSANKVVQIEVNGVLTSAVMKIGKGGEAFWLHPTYIRQQHKTHLESAGHQHAAATRHDDAVGIDSNVGDATHPGLRQTHHPRTNSAERHGAEKMTQHGIPDLATSVAEEEEEAHNTKQENAKLAREALAAAAKAEQRLSKLRLNEGPFLWELPANGKDSTSMSAVGACAAPSDALTSGYTPRREPTQDLKDAMPPSSPTEYDAPALPDGAEGERRPTHSPHAARAGPAVVLTSGDDRRRRGASTEVSVETREGGADGEDSGTSNAPGDSDGAAEEDDVYTLDPIELNDFSDSLTHRYHRRSRVTGMSRPGSGGDEGDAVSSDEPLNSSFGSSVTSGVSVEEDAPRSDTTSREAGVERRTETRPVSSSMAPRNTTGDAAVAAVGGHETHSASAATEHPANRSELDMATEHDAVRHGQTYFTRSLVPTLDDLRKLNLRDGCNEVRYITHTNYERRTVSVTCNIFLWDYTARLVVSDVDGTITKSDMWGHFYAMFGKGAEWTHPGICSLYSKIAHNGYHMIYLTARSVTQIYQTKNYLWSLVQDDQQRLPLGPVLTTPQRIFTAIKKEVSRQSHVFKIACLNSVLAAFPTHTKPFFAGFGNRYNDVVSYSAVNIPTHKIFIIDPSSVLHVCRVKHTYRNLVHLVDVTFPPIRVRSCGGHVPRPCPQQQPAFTESHPATTLSRKPPVVGQPRSPSSSTSGAAAGPSEADDDVGPGSDANSLSSLSEDEYAREAVGTTVGLDVAGQQQQPQLLLRASRGGAFYLSNSTAVTHDVDALMTTKPGGVASSPDTGGKMNTSGALRSTTANVAAAEDALTHPSAPLPPTMTTRTQTATSSRSLNEHRTPGNVVTSAAAHANQGLARLSAPTSDDELHIDPDFSSFQYWHVDPRDLITTPRPPPTSQPTMSMLSGSTGPAAFGGAAGLPRRPRSSGCEGDRVDVSSTSSAVDAAPLTRHRDAEATTSSEATTSGSSGRKAGSFFSRVWPHTATTTQDHGPEPPPRPIVPSTRGFMHPDYISFPIPTPATLTRGEPQSVVVAPTANPQGELTSAVKPELGGTEELTAISGGAGMRAPGEASTAPASTSWAFWKKSTAREGSAGTHRKDELGAFTSADGRATRSSERV